MQSPHRDEKSWVSLSILQIQALQAVPALVSSDKSSTDLVSPDNIAILIVDAVTW